jgi:hypothetical protein
MLELSGLLNERRSIWSTARSSPGGMRAASG